MATSGGWQKMKDIFSDVVALPAEQRAARLDQVCAGDADLREQIEQLLGAHADARTFLETPAAMTEIALTLRVGQRIGPYEIAAHAGSGGMGDVYKAVDTRLNRTVAIKVLPSHISRDPRARERFEGEARAVAALNHPNICTLHDVGHVGDLAYLVMEYLDGETLAARLQRGTLKPDVVLRYAIEIASALDKVHRAGIVHRDLKPGNIMLTSTGAKLLDFGLSKTGVPTVFDATRAFTPDVTLAGTILGTLRYMAPEQLDGKRVDARSDIFAFGAVLYEMATRRKAFDGATVDEIAGVIRDGDSPTAAHAPPALGRVIRTCLEKDPDDRWQTARDLLRELRWIAEGSGTIDTGSTPGRTGRWIALGIAAVVVAALVVTATMLVVSRRGEGEVSPVRFEVATPPTSDPTSFALSPDGRHLAFVADVSGRSKLWIRHLNETSAQPLDGTEGASYPFWSPAAKAIGFFAEGKLKRIDVGGVLPQTIADAPNGRGGSWNRDGVILYVPTTAGVVMRVAANGGTPSPATKLAPGHRSHRWPFFLPDGRHFLFMSTHGDPGTEGIYFGALDGSAATRVLEDESAAVYTSGRLLFEREGALESVAFDVERGRVAGDMTTVVRPVGSDTIIRAAFSASDTGVLAHRVRVAGARQLTWVDQSGKVLEAFGPVDNDALSSPELTRDGRRVAVYRSVDANADVWVLPIPSGVPNRITVGPRIDALPIWSSDGRRVIYCGASRGVWSVLTRSVDDGGDDTPLFRQSEIKVPLDISPDGRFLLYAVQVPQTGVDLWAAPMPNGGDANAFPIVQTPFDDMGGQFSPDGEWIAYASTASGRLETYVRKFRTGTAQQVSSDGGSQPRWSPDGHELYYVAADEWLMAVAIRFDGGRITASTPRRLFRTHLATGANILPAVGSRAQYAVSRDGRFLLNVAVDGAAAPPIIVTTSWQALAAR